jgi:hypothetical protein
VFPRLPLIASVLILSASASARAGTFTYSDYTMVDNTATYVFYDSTYYEVGGAGQIDLIGAGTSINQTLATWCIDLPDSLQPYDLSGPFTVVSGSPAGFVPPVSGGQAVLPALTSQQISEMGGLMAYGDASLTSIANISTATQIAIWAIEYGPAYSFETYIGDTPDPAVTTLASQLVSQAESGAIPGSDDWETLTLPGGVSQVLAAVPEPGSFALLGAGLVSLYGARRWRGRDAARALALGIG